jgi:hypothetical protein
MRPSTIGLVTLAAFLAVCEAKAAVLFRDDLSGTSLDPTKWTIAIEPWAAPYAPIGVRTIAFK